MDENVLAAMARWPNVPDVFGWLSLSERGQWRLHPQGDALTASQQAGRADRLPGNGPRQRDGEEIGSPAITAFMNRNYTSDAHGRWYFQNGPQRVFVRLDGAPYILFTTGSSQSLVTHNGLAITRISTWILDDVGHLYAQTEHGPGLVAGRDLPALIDALGRDGRESLELAMAHTSELGSTAMLNYSTGVAPLQSCTADTIAAKLGFVRFPDIDPHARTRHLSV